MDMSDWIKDKVGDGELKCFSKEHEPSDFSWLGKQCAITPWGVYDGGCDSYGHMHGTEVGDICVLKLNWEAIPKKKANEWDDGDEETAGALPGILVHEACFCLLRDALSELKPLKAFKSLEKHLDDMDQCLDCVPAELYGPIVRNQGQDYELNENEGYLIAPITPIDELPGMLLERPTERLLPEFPTDLGLMICGKLDTEALLALALTCKAWLQYARYAPLWTSRGHAIVDDESILRTFSSAESMANYQRCRRVADSIISSCLQAPAEKAKKEVAEGDWTQYTVAMLKEELRSRNLKVSGKKSELIARLEENPAKKIKISE